MCTVFAWCDSSLYIDVCIYMCRHMQAKQGHTHYVRVRKNAFSKNKGRCRDGAVCTCKVWQNHLAENRRNKEEGQSMQKGGQPAAVHAKPRPLTFADFEYIYTIPTSGNILPRLLATTAQPFRLFSFPFAPTGTALQFTHLSALLTVLYLPFPQGLSLQIACYPIYFAVL